MRRNGRLEAHIEHAVHLVQHQDLYLVQAHQPALEEVLQPSRRGHNEPRSAANGIELRPFGHAADHQGHRLRGTGANGAEVLLHLHGQLPRGQQDQRMGAAPFHLLGAPCFCLLEHFNDGDEETERFAGPGLRRGQHVAAFQRGRNGPGLHRRGSFKFVMVKPRQKGGRK